MMTGIIGAMEIEINSIKDAMQCVESRTISGIPFYKGKLYNRNAVLARCGIGKVNAAVCAQIMISVFGVDEIINTGVAGAVAHGVRQSDIVIAESFVQHDMDTSPIGDPVGFVSTVNKIYFEADKEIISRLKSAVPRDTTDIIGVIATGDRFVADKAYNEILRSRFNAAACDMEGGAIAHVCTLAGVPFGAVRCISDSADEKASMDYPEFAAKAAKSCAQIVLEYMRETDCRI